MAKINPTKATHRGTCQLCGAVQKLPLGRLSLHGYNVRFGFFMGTCPGSGAPPLEVSCDRLAAARDSALARAQALQAEADSVRVSVASVWVSEFVSATWTTRKSSNRWREFPLAEVSIDGARIGWIHLDGRLQTHHMGGASPTVARLNAARADFLVRSSAELIGYANFLEATLTVWAPKPLLALAA